MNNSHKIKVKRLKNSPYAIQEGQPLGKGSFATIRRAYNLQNINQELAVKIISINDEQTAKTIKSQLQMLRQLPSHLNLVNTMKVQISSQKNFYIIMEYCNQGNLQKYIFDHKNDLSEQKIWFFLKQFCDGYKVLYDKNIIHRDIKPENILIKNGNFKISDFGLAKVTNNAQFVQNLSSKGTPLYMAPQLHFQKQGNSKVDIFSLGIILYRLSFRGKFPFFDNGRTYHSVGQYFQQLMVKKLTFPAKHNRSGELIQLIERMLVKNQQNRISWKQIFLMQKIKKAVRNERRKQIIPMQQFRKSLLVIANTSTTDMKLIENQQIESKQNKMKQVDQLQEAFLIIQEAFNKKNKTNLQKKLFKNKLMYTLIDIFNRRIANLFLHDSTSIHSYISAQLQKIVNVGMIYCLFLLSKLENISGDWNSISTGEVLNFQDIFDNDRDIIVEKLKVKGLDQQPRDYKEGTYQLLLYNILTEYQDYPKQTQKLLRPIIAFMIDLYDLTIKFNEEGRLEEQQRKQFKKFEEQEIQKFQQYLYQIENVKSQDINPKLRKMGLLLI